MSGADQPSPDALKAYSFRAFSALQGAVTAAMIHLGDRLGLYRSLADGEPTNAEELATRTGLSERWLREWLYNQGAAGMLASHPGDRFALAPEGRAVLAQEDHPAFGAGMFQQLPELMGVLPRLEESFRSGIGLPYDAFGPEGAQGIERGFAPWYRNFLVPAVRGIEGVAEILEAGGRVADVGCGGGVALIELAGSFPRAELHGYDVSRHAVERARANQQQAGLDSVAFHLIDEEPLPDDGRFDLVLTFDCLHDMTDPKGVMQAIRSAIAPDGVWLIADIKCLPSYEANAEKNPMAAMMYGVSVLSCMSSALSEPGGAGLGTLGFHEPLARDMTASAGFTRFRRLDIEHPINAFYEVRP